RSLDVVHAAERGHVVMSSGPFMEVELRASGETGAPAIPGDERAVPDGHVTLRVRVQCPNWFDIDRIQVFVNGRAIESLNFTRAAMPQRFSSSTAKFDGEIPVVLQGDAHVIVAAIGEGSKLGPVMGPDHGADRPVA